jgi:sugar O-acyltransferase (sialic acid O-acetyltransferase NeuD family)
VYYGGVGGVSSYLVTVGPVLALTVAMFGRRHSSTWLVLLGLPFLAVTLLSAQRALWPAIGLQAALVCAWLWQVRAVAVGPLRLALTGLILLALMGGGVYVSDRYRTGGNPESLVAMRNDLRPRVWKRVGAEILAHPLTGAGFGRGVMAKAYPALLPAADNGFWHPHNGVLLAESKVFWHPHNLVLNYGISAGVPGMVAVLALFAALAWRFWLLAVHGEPLAGLSGLAGAAMVAGVLTRNMANDFFVRDGALLFWALAGMLFGYSLRRGSTHEGDPSGLRQARAGRCSAVPSDTKDAIVVISAGGHAKVVISTLTARGLVIGSVFDDDDTKWGMDAQGARVGRIERERGGRGIIGIGDNAQRREMARALNFEWQTVVHPSACVHPSAKLGRGTVVFAGAVVQPDAVLGDHVIVNTGATVDHDCIVGDYAHLAPGVHLAGSVHVGEGSFLGIGSVVVPGVTIGRWSTLGAGAVAIRDLADGAVAVGVPAMTLKREEGGNSPA